MEFFIGKAFLPLGKNALSTFAFPMRMRFQKLRRGKRECVFRAQFRLELRIFVIKVGRTPMTESKRNSNMELLRIVAMLMIVAYHIYCHCVSFQLTDTATMYRLHNGWFSQPLFYKKLLILTAVAPMGQIGNAIFLIISGYFMVGKERNIGIVKTSKKLLFQQGFAAVLLTVCSTALYRCTDGLYIKLIDINFFNQMAWYVGYYFLVILIAYLFLNSFLAKQDRKQYSRFLIVTFAVTQFSWAAGILSGLSGGLATVLTGVFLYSLGGYIKRYDPYGNIRLPVIFAVIATIYGLLCVATYDTAINKIVTYTWNEDTSVFKQSIPGVDNNYIIPIVTGVALFEIFKRMSLPKNKVINYLVASTFMVYLIHDNSFFYSLWYTQDWITLLYYHPLKYICKYALWTFGTFAIGVAAYSLYLLLVKLVKKYAHVFLKKDSQCSV